MIIKKIIKIIYPYLIALILLIFVWKYFSGAKLLDALDYFNVNIIVFCFLYYIIIIKPINTIRYSLFFDIKDRIKLYWILNLSNFILNFIPFRLGEYSYIRLIKRYYNIKAERSVPGILTIRFFDYISILLFFILAFFYSGVLFNIGNILLVSFLIPIFIMLFLIIITFLFRKFDKRNNRLYKIVFLSYQELKHYSSNKIIVLFLTTLAYWTGRFSYGYLVLILLEIKINFGLFIFITSVLIIISLIPIQIFANFGIFEFGWIYILNLVEPHISKPELFNKILAFHIIPLFPVIVMGVLGYLFLIHSNSKHTSS